MTTKFKSGAMRDQYQEMSIVGRGSDLESRLGRWRVSIGSNETAQRGEGSGKAFQFALFYVTARADSTALHPSQHIDLIGNSYGITSLLRRIDTC